MAAKLIWMLIDKKATTLAALIKLLGIYTVLKILTKVLYKIYKHFLRPSFDLSARYGRGSYALITGGSDGIGKAYAIELAKRGFNIILVARNKDKLDAAEGDIKKANRFATVKQVVADFANSNFEGFFDKLYDQVKEGTDISILVNNVGLDYPEFFLETNEKKLADLITVNVLPEVFLTRKILPDMQKRDKRFRSLIINMASASGTFAQPYTAVYCATKAFNDFFSRALSLEFYCSRVDILSVRPFYVGTAMNAYKQGSDSITPNECVKGILSKVGWDIDTYGGLNHSLQGFGTELFTSLPYCIQQFGWKTVGKDMTVVDKKRLEEFAKKK